MHALGATRNSHSNVIFLSGWIAVFVILDMQLASKQWYFSHVFLLLFTVLCSSYFQNWCLQFMGMYCLLSYIWLQFAIFQLQWHVLPVGCWCKREGGVNNPQTKTSKYQLEEYMCVRVRACLRALVCMFVHACRCDLMFFVITALQLSGLTRVQNLFISV